jgi:hypothetical protein
MKARDGESEVLEVEVERLPLPDEQGAPGEASGSSQAAAGGRGTARRAHAALGPILAGLATDALDGATLSPVLGLGLGLPVGYYLARQLGLEGASAWRMAALVGLYCALPGTNALPIGTLFGGYVRLKQALGQTD